MDEYEFCMWLNGFLEAFDGAGGIPDHSVKALQTKLAGVLNPPAAKSGPAPQKFDSSPEKLFEENLFDQQKKNDPPRQPLRESSFYLKC